ncbi:MAG: DUF4760 domain-containing protein [Alphaproteobacteria bacterium]
MDCSELTQLANQPAEAAQGIIVCVASSFEPATLITPLVIAVSVFLAWRSIRSSAASARMRATLDLIEKSESTPEYRENHKIFVEHRLAGSFGRLHAPETDTDKTHRQRVHAYLNHYELIAIGIEKEILDEAFYKNWIRSGLVRDWNAAGSFIQRERWRDDGQGGWVYHTSLYEYYQRLAARWSDDAVQLDEHSGGHPAAPSGPGDGALPIDGKA